MNTDDFPDLATFSIVMGVMFMAACLIEVFGVVAATTVCSYVFDVFPPPLTSLLYSNDLLSSEYTRWALCFPVS